MSPHQHGVSVESIVLSPAHSIIISSVPQQRVFTRIWKQCQQQHHSSGINQDIIFLRHNHISIKDPWAEPRYFPICTKRIYGYQFSFPTTAKNSNILYSPVKGRAELENSIERMIWKLSNKTLIWSSIDVISARC